jgi:thiamine biosynthesis protein ThiS
MSEVAADVEVSVNGQLRRLPLATTVLGLIERLRLEPALVAVERNGEVVPRSQHGGVVLEAGDAVELVTFVGGG